MVDTDWPGWAEEGPTADGTRTEQLWHEDRMAALLAEPTELHLFVSGCVANQVRFYDRFDAIVLLAARLEVMLARVSARDDNPYGKSPTESRQIRADLEQVEPLLRSGATDEVDARLPVDDVVESLIAIAGAIDT